MTHHPRKTSTARVDRITGLELAAALEWLFAWTEKDVLPASVVRTWLTGRFHISAKEADLLLVRALSAHLIRKIKREGERRGEPTDRLSLVEP